jgi:hypothetical protein
MTRGARRVRTAVAAAGAMACAVLALPDVAKADPAADCPAARVTGVSAVLDAVATGSAAGPSVLFGVALVPLSQPLPAPLDAAQAQALTLGADGVQQMRTDAPGQIDQLRAGIAPLASGNEFANQGVEALAAGLDTAADTAGPAIAPGDTTLREAATVVRANHEPRASC